jgi:hypothetical protein
MIKKHYEDPAIQRVYEQVVKSRMKNDYRLKGLNEEEAGEFVYNEGAFTRIEIEDDGTMTKHEKF